MTNCIYSRDGWCELNGEDCDGNREACPEFASSAFEVEPDERDRDEVWVTAEEAEDEFQTS